MSKTCARCLKTVYPTEELKCLDKVTHPLTPPHPTSPHNPCSSSLSLSLARTRTRTRTPRIPPSRSRTRVASHLHLRLHLCLVQLQFVHCTWHLAFGIQHLTFTNWRLATMPIDAFTFIPVIYNFFPQTYLSLAQLLLFFIHSYLYLYVRTPSLSNICFRLFIHMFHSLTILPTRSFVINT